MIPVVLIGVLENRTIIGIKKVAKLKRKVSSRTRRKVIDKLVRIAGEHVQSRQKFDKKLRNELIDLLEERGDRPALLDRLKDRKQPVPFFGVDIRREQRDDIVKFKTGRTKLYIYKQKDPVTGKQIRGHWIALNRFKAWRGTRRYWGRVRSLKSIYQMDNREARTLMNILKDPDLPPSERNRIENAYNIIGTP